nr:MAG TPA: Transcriptional regulator FleQ factor, AAA+, ATPase, c-di-GMP [Caudoviricetes sp.]
MNDVTLERLLIEHYLFDLGESVEKTAEILDMDEDTVRRVHRESSRFYSAVRRNH